MPFLRFDLSRAARTMRSRHFSMRLIGPCCEPSRSLSATATRLSRSMLSSRACASKTPASVLSAPTRWCLSTSRRDRAWPRQSRTSIASYAKSFQRAAVIQPSDAMASIVENTDADWSLGNGEAPAITGQAWRSSLYWRRSSPCASAPGDAQTAEKYAKLLNISRCRHASRALPTFIHPDTLEREVR